MVLEGRKRLCLSRRDRGCIGSSRSSSSSSLRHGCLWTTASQHCFSHNQLARHTRTGRTARESRRAASGALRVATGAVSVRAAAAVAVA